MNKHQELLSLLQDGKTNAKQASDIREQLSMEKGRTEEPTRDLIREMIEDNNYPIGSNRDGYFLIDTQEELEEVVESLQSRIKGLQSRIKWLTLGWKKRQNSRESGGNWPK